MALTPVEIGEFRRLFVRGGCVLDFTRSGLDAFIQSYVGVSPCDKYQLPMGKSFDAWCKSASDHDRVRALAGLLEYYEARFGDGLDSGSQRYDREASFEPLFRRHARLAVGSSVTFVEYVWDTYEWRLGQGLMPYPIVGRAT